MDNGYGGASYVQNGKIIPTQYFNYYADYSDPMQRVSNLDLIKQAIKYLLPQQREVKKYYNPNYLNAIENMTTSERLNFDRNLRGY